MTLTLHFHPLASFCHKALIALDELGLAFEPVIVDLGDPASRAAFAEVWPLLKFPGAARLRPRRDRRRIDRRHRVPRRLPRRPA